MGARGGAINCQAGPIDPDLPVVVEAWLTLPVAVKERILALVEANKLQNDQG